MQLDSDVPGLTGDSSFGLFEISAALSRIAFFADSLNNPPLRFTPPRVSAGDEAGCTSPVGPTGDEFMIVRV